MILLEVVRQSNVSMREVPEVDHKTLSVIKKTRRSIKYEIRAKKEFRRRRRKKKELALNRENALDGSYLASLGGLPQIQVKSRARKKRRKSSLEAEVCCKRRERGINFMKSIIIIILSLEQVTCSLGLAQQHQLDSSPIKVAQAFRPITISRPNSKLEGSQLVGAIRRPVKKGFAQAETDTKKLQYDYIEQPGAANSLTLNSVRHSEKVIEEQNLKLDYGLGRSKRSVEISPNPNQIVYDSANSGFKGEQLEFPSLERRQQRSIEDTVIKQQAKNCSEFSELEPEAGSEAAKIRQLLSRYYRVESSLIRKPPQITSDGTNQIADSNSNEARGSSAKLELPRPSNVSVLIISWYPPILKLSWNLNELSEGDTSRLNFYENNSETSSNERHGASFPPSTSSSSSSSSSSASSSASPTFYSYHQDKDLLSEFDLELAIDNAAAIATATATATTSTQNSPERRQNVTEGADDNLEDVSTVDADIELARELRRRRFLVRKSLTCFQITYNIINSRFKIIEEYPPYLRSIMLERLLPATEYSLHVVAVYLNRYRLFSERVQFVSPTDNESRRFKEGTYRPIHRYPDEPKRHLRYGLGQVRSEELTIVAIALLFWIATICLFFNKWGKIRMLEPYQPAYRESSTATFVHHHPSIHNMQNCSPGSGSDGTGSGPLAGIGAKMSGLCGGSGGPIFETMQPLCTQTPASQAPLMTTTAIATNRPSAGDICMGQQKSKQDVGLPVVPTTQTGATKLGASSGIPQRSLDLVGIEQQQQQQSQHQPQQRSFESAAQFGRRQSRGLLVRGRKRFETVGDEPLVPIKQRTNDELNYLFQTKAQALVKATALWSMKQQQKLRQQQLCARLTESEQQKQQDEFEMLRRTSQVSSMLRQRHYSNQPLAAAGGGLVLAGSPFCQTREATQLSGGTQRPVDEGVKEQPETEEAEEYNEKAAEAEAGAAAAMTTTGRRDARKHSLKYRRQSRAFDYTINRSGATNSLDSQQNSGSHAQSDQSGASGRNSWSRSGGAQSEEVSSTNKLRRLMFLSKTHQHHHIATSISSSTLMNNSSLGERGGGSSGFAGDGERRERTSSYSNNERRFSTSQLLEGSFVKLTSVSVDSGSQNRAENDNSKETHSEDLTGQNDLHRLNRLRDQEFAQDLCSSLKSEVDLQGQIGKSVLSLDSNKSAGKSQNVVVELSHTKEGPHLSNNGSKQRVEHHILIEPPSPPYKQLVEEEGQEREGGECGECDLMCKSREEPFLETGRLAESDSGTGKRMDEFTCLASAQFGLDRGHICSKERLLEEGEATTLNEEPVSRLKSDKTQITGSDMKPPRLIMPETSISTEGSDSDKVALEAWRQQQQQWSLVIEQKQVQQQQKQKQQKRRASESACQIQIHIQTAKRKQKGSKQDLHCDSESGWPSTSSYTHLGGPLLTSARDLSQVGKQGKTTGPEINFYEASPGSFNKFIKLREGEDREEEEQEDGDDENKEEMGRKNDEEVNNNESYQKRLLNKQANNGSDTDDAFAKLAKYTARKHSRNSHTHSLSHTSVQLLQNSDYLRHQSFCAGVGIGIAGIGSSTISSSLQTYGGSSRAIHTNPQLPSPQPAPASTSRHKHRLHLANTCSCGSGNTINFEGQLRAPLLYETSGRDDDTTDYNNNNNHPTGTCLTTGVDDQASGRGRISSVFAGCPYSRVHRDSFAMLSALSQKKSKSAEDVAYLSSLVLQIWVRDRNPLLQSASQQQLSLSRRQSSSQDRSGTKQQRPKSSLNVSHF